MKTVLPLIVILGPTACGKTRLAVHLARRLGGEVISADSRQVYRGMDIGTGKDLSEYFVDNEAIPYHLIDILAAGAQYNVHQFQQDFQEVLTDIDARQKQPILCGGTGLYIEAVLRNYQFTAIPVDETLRQALAQRTDDELLTIFQNSPSAYTPMADTSTRKRLIRAIEIAHYLYQNPHLPNTQHAIRNTQYAIPNAQYATRNAQYLIFGLSLPVELRRERITARLHERLQNGMVEEVQQLLDSGLTPEQLVYYGLEYKFITQYLTSEMDYDTMTTRLNVAIHQFAKRQMTYFRKMERDGLLIHWLDATKPTSDLVEDCLDACKNAFLNL
ncbi:MAG: tRNA (adenosine(37)-N6)-dimethylallyltransferase MiaA [Spirosomaceae bacterium]|nr:tRNA (adenosine(37)-N6)-dimethylallyltransferase MiaA [Spirosomataceae bacterium]